MKKISVLIVTVLCAAVLCSCSSQKNDTKKENSSPVSASTAVQNFKTVDTPYAKLKVPADFENNVTEKVESEDPYTLSFSAKDGQKLFTLYFGKETENLIGTLKLNDKNVIIYADFEKIDEKNKNYEKYMSYQEGINTIIENLQKDYDFAVNEALENEDNTTFDIKTSVVTLKYPNKYKDKVKVDVQKDRVKFSSDKTPLFDIVFKKCDGDLLGTYNDTPIYVVNYDVKTDEQAAMQEAVNTIISNLEKDKNFKINLK